MEKQGNRVGELSFADMTKGNEEGNRIVRSEWTSDSRRKTLKTDTGKNQLE